MKTKMIVKILIGVIVIGGGLGYFTYQAMQSSWSYYYSVDEFSANISDMNNYSLRIAGRVKPGSVNRDLQNMNLKFTLAGVQTEIPVVYVGTVPDNFTDDIEVVVEGKLDENKSFKAKTLMTKCESKYKAKVE
jgi:cytochrome c-type biogenesis protein CcmE